MTDKRSRKWICLVCGYIHQGDEAPNTCPVCGVEKDRFEEHVIPEVLAVPAKKSEWRCLICNYSDQGETAPDICPVCGAGQDQFERVPTTSSLGRSSVAGKRILIIGGGIAGIAAAESIREVNAAATIIVITREQELPYYRLNLTRYLAGEVALESLPIHPESWYEENNIQLIRGVNIKQLAASAYSVTLSTGETVTYDSLIIACGAHPFLPPIPGAYREGVLTVRTIKDADFILRNIKPGMKVVCIGGGVLGLETAGGLVRRGASVTVLENYDWLLPRQLNQRAGELLADHVRTLGIKVQCGMKNLEIVGDEWVQGVSVAQPAELLAADWVIVTAGVRTNSYLARQAGLDVRQGIVVNAQMETSHPHIYAAGDVAEYNGAVYGLWDPARQQGITAGMNAAGLHAKFSGMPRSNMLKVLGIDLFSVGIVQPDDGAYVEIDESGESRYSRFVFRDHKLVGAILVGDTKMSAAVTQAIKTQMDFAEAFAPYPAIETVKQVLRSI